MEGLKDNMNEDNEKVENEKVKKDVKRMINQILDDHFPLRTLYEFDSIGIGYTKPAESKEIYIRILLSPIE